MERYAYDPFGTVTVMTGSYGARSGSSYGWVYGFQGGRLDAITCENHFGERDEDPTTGAWNKVDPARFCGDNVNFYQLEWNSPVDVRNKSEVEPPMIIPLIPADQADGTHTINGSQWNAQTGVLTIIIIKYQFKNGEIIGFSEDVYDFYIGPSQPPGPTNPNPYTYPLPNPYNLYNGYNWTIQVEEPGTPPPWNPRNRWEVKKPGLKPWKTPPLGVVPQIPGTIKTPTPIHK